MADGLKKMRKNQVDKTPQYECSNCKCKRYSPCTCMKGGQTGNVPIPENAQPAPITSEGTKENPDV